VLLKQRAVHLRAQRDTGWSRMLRATAWVRAALGIA
jgi:hypothetical protein